MSAPQAAPSGDHSPSMSPTPGQAVCSPCHGRACVCPRSQAPARLAKCWLWDPDAGGGRGVHLMHLRHPQPRRARAGGRTRPCDERFVPPLLSHPGGWKGKGSTLGRGTNPSRCCKSALGVCPALQTLGVRAVPSPLWVATVWRSELRNRARQDKNWSPQKGLGTTVLAHAAPGTVMVPCAPHTTEPPRGTLIGVGTRGQGPTKLPSFWGNHSDL